MANSWSKSSYCLMLQNLLQRLVRSLHAQTQRYALQQGISFPECKVLLMMRTGKPIEMTKISKELSVTRAFATYIADQLVGHEMITRQRSTTDRRKIILTFTNKGKRRLKKLEAFRGSPLKAVLAGLKEADKEKIAEVISMLVALFEAKEKV